MHIRIQSFKSRNAIYIRDPETTVCIIREAFSVTLRLIYDKYTSPPTMTPNARILFALSIHLSVYPRLISSSMHKYANITAD